MPDAPNQATPLEVSPVVAGSDRGRRSVGIFWYVLGFAAVQVALLAAVLFATTRPWFMNHDDYPGLRNAGYSLRAQHEDCEVLIYGDSSSLTGLDPEVIQSVTGMKTCNISEGGTIQGVVGSNYPIDQYLKHNKRPRFLLAMYTPSKFSPYRDLFDDDKPEGMIYGFQYDRDSDFLHGLLKHLTEVRKFDILAGHALIADVVDFHLPFISRSKPEDARAQRDSRMGIWPYPLPPETQCVRGEPEDLDSYKRDEKSVAAMRERYAVEGTQVLINLAPIPVCDASQDIYRKMSEGLHDNPFETLPIEYFNEGDVHFSPQGSRYISLEAGRQILALETRTPAQQQGRPQ